MKKIMGIFGQLLCLSGLLLLASCSDDNPVTANSPVASFGYSSARTFPATVSFTNTSTGTGAVSFFWDFGDGSTSFVQNPVHVYNAQGIYNVRLSQTDAAGMSDTFTLAIQLTSAGPSGQSNRSSSANFSYAITTPYTCTFTNTSINANAYLWDFGDGTTSTSNSASFTKDFTAPGTYTVKLNANGTGSDSSTAVIVFN